MHDDRRRKRIRVRCAQRVDEVEAVCDAGDSSDGDMAWADQIRLNHLLRTHSTATPYLFHNLLFELFDHLVDPLLNLLFRLLPSSVL